MVRAAASKTSNRRWREWQEIRQLQGFKSRGDSNFDALNEVLFAVSAVRELTTLVAQ